MAVPCGALESRKRWSYSQLCSFLVVKHRASGFDDVWQVVWSSKYVRFLPHFPSFSLSCWDRCKAGQRGAGLREPSPGSQISGAWLMLPRDCKEAGLQCWFLLPFSQVHSDLGFLFLPRLTFCEWWTRAVELPAIPKPSCEPVWWRLCLPRLHESQELGSQKATVPAGEHVAGLCLSARLPAHLKRGQGLQSL